MRTWVVCLAGAVMVAMLGLVEWNVFHVGWFGFSYDADSGRIYGVAPGSPAGRAGIVDGERIQLSQMTQPMQRRILMEPGIGESLALVVTGNGHVHRTTLVAERQGNTVATFFDAIGLGLLVFISFGLATALLVLRPQPATWAFYAYTFLMAIKAFEGNLLVHPPGGAAALYVMLQLAWSASVVALLFFATRIFASHRVWSRVAEGLAIVLGAIDAFVWFWPGIAFLYAWHSAVRWTVVQRSFDAAFLALVVFSLIAIAVQVRREQRQRALWVIAAISLVPIVEFIDALVALVDLHSGGAAHPAMVWMDGIDAVTRPWLPIIASVGVYYVLVHERIVDIRFALGRAAEYALTTAVVVVFFALLEWGFGQLFEGSSVAPYTTLMAAVIVGFTFNAVHERVDKLVDMLFFWRQREAEERLLRVSRALLYANTERLVIEFLLDHPMEALDLRSGAIFTLNDARTAYVRTAAKEWGTAPLTEIAADDALVAELRSERAPIDLRATGWKAEGLPGHGHAPVLGVPVIMRGEVYAIALYGGRDNGTKITADETQLLESVAANAAAAFDHLDADRTRREIEALRRENAALQSAPSAASISSSVL